MTKHCRVPLDHVGGVRVSIAMAVDHLLDDVPDIELEKGSIRLKLLNDAVQADWIPDGEKAS